MQELAIRAVPVQVRCEFDDYQVVVYETEAGELTAVGSLLCTEGECVLHGNFSQHKKYGKQFQVTYCADDIGRDETVSGEQRDCRNRKCNGRPHRGYVWSRNISSHA